MDQLDHLFPEWEALEEGERRLLREDCLDSLKRFLDSQAWLVLHRMVALETESAQRQLNTMNLRHYKAPQLQGSIQTLHRIRNSLLAYGKETQDDE